MMMLDNAFNNAVRKVVPRKGALIAFVRNRQPCDRFVQNFVSTGSGGIRCYHLSSLAQNGTTVEFSSSTRTLSATTTDRSATTTVTTDKTDTSAKNPPKKKDEKNIFLDNLGTIFLSAIGLIIAYLVRSFYGSTKRNALRDELQERAELDPLEIDELRRVNPGLTANVFRSLLQEVWIRYPHGELTYTEFAETIRELLVKKHPQHHQVPTIEFGYLLDRVVLHVLEMQGESSTKPQSIALWMTVLSLALNAPIRDRVQVLHEILLHEQQNQSVPTEGQKLKASSEIGELTSSSTTAATTVRLDQVRRLVQYLQATDQLVIETQLFPTVDKAYPIQLYHQGSPHELVQWDGSDSDPIDVDALDSILRSRSVCAWGECYRKVNH